MNGFAGGDLTGFPAAPARFTLANGGGVTVAGIGPDGNTLEALNDTLGMPDDGIENKSNEFGMADYARPERGGFTGSVYKRIMMDDADDEHMDMLTLYTNVGAPGEGDYQTRYGTGNAGDRDGIMDISRPGEGANYNVLTFSADVSDISMHFMSSMFSTADSGSTMLEGMNDQDTDADDRAFDGHFHGVPGTYTCTTTTGCTVVNDDEGNLVQIVGLLTFAPDETETGDPAHKVAGIVPDTDYLVFGYWVRTTTDDDDKTTRAITAVSLGMDPYGTPGASVEGTATYEGAAAGLYVLKEGNVGDYYR